MGDDESKKSFWSSAGGMLTGIGGVMAATAGLLTALNAIGWFGPKKPTDNPPAMNILANTTAFSTPTPQLHSNSRNPPEQVVPEEAAPTPVQASRNFIVGRWQVEQASGDMSGGTLIDYDPDGTFAGTMTVFVGGVGQKQRTAGRWYSEKLSKDMFRLTLEFENQPTWRGTFRIIDQDHIHNIDQNYMAVRIR